MTTLPFMQRPRPDGYREYVNDEADELCQGSPIAVLDTHTNTVLQGHVYSITDGYANVQFSRAGHIESLDLDVPDAWGEDDMRERRTPTSDDGQFVAVTNAPKPVHHDSLASILRDSVKIAKLTRRVRTLEAVVKLQSDQIQALMGPRAVAS